MKKTLILFILGVAFIPSLVLASTVVIEADTLNISVNALEATIQVPKSVTVSKILDGNSSIIFWVTPASIDANTNIITLAGITPGGFAGKVNLLSLVGNFQPTDYKNFVFSDVTAFKNDGKGTVTKIKLFVANTSDLTDAFPPEPFTPIISSSPDLFMNNQFLSFATEDKGVGIDHYEFKSSFVLFGNPDLENWQTVQSPLELKSINLFQKLFIRAIDKSGNEITQSTVGPYFYYLWAFIWVIIISLALWVLLYIRKLLG